MKFLIKQTWEYYGDEDDSWEPVVQLFEEERCIYTSYDPVEVKAHLLDILVTRGALTGVSLYEEEDTDYPSE